MKILPFLSLVFILNTISAQSDSGKITISNPFATKQDTILQRSLPTVNVIEKNKHGRTPIEEEAYQKLKRKVIKLYPYALLAKQVYETTNQNTQTMESNKEKNKFRKQKEQELRNRFENEIKALYTSDGPILVKLIHRETGKTTYDLLRESKSWINCTIYQMTAKHYGYSLKDTFDPIIDKDIENVVQILKSEGQLPIFSL